MSFGARYDVDVFEGELSPAMPRSAHYNPESGVAIRPILFLLAQNWILAFQCEFHVNFILFGCVSSR